MPSTGTTKTRELLARAILVTASVVVVLVLVGAIETGIRLADPDLMIRRRGLQQYHPQLGWENRPNIRSKASGVSVSLDLKGRRSSGDQPGARTDRTHLVLLGDSVAFGLGVSDDETFSASLAQGATPYRVTNMAVPGYGPDQSLLAYEGATGQSLDASVVVFALCLGNDLADVVSPHHLYSDGIPKPRFLKGDGVLVLDDGHVRRARLRWWLDRSFLLARMGAPLEAVEQSSEQTHRRLKALRAYSTEAEDILVAILERIRGHAESRGARFVVVAFPDERAVEHTSVRWPRLREKMTSRVEILDLVPRLARDRESYRRHSLDHIGHLTRRGHEQAARHLKTWLEGSGDVE